MKITKLFLKYTATLLLFILIGKGTAIAQVTYNSKNTATVTGTAPGGVQVNDVSNSGINITRGLGDQTPVVFPMIGLAKTASAPVLQSNGTYDVTYTLRIQNYSTIALNNIQITDNLELIFPDNATNASYTIKTPPSVLTSDPINDGTGTITVNSSFNGLGDKNLLIATTSSLTSNASGVAYFATIQFTINIDPKGISAAYKTYNNTATVTAKTPSSPDEPSGVTVTDVSHNNASPNNNNASTTPLAHNAPTPITLAVSDIQVTKTASSLTPDEDSNVTFTIKVRNNGSGSAAPVVVNDALPLGFQYVSKTVSQGTYDQATGIWSVGTLIVGAANEQTLTVTAKVLANKTVAEYTNTASSNHPGDPISTNNSDEVVITPRKIADLSITNTDGKATYTPGTTNTYTIVVTNAGPSDVTGATVANTLPTGFTGTWTAVYAAGTAPGSVISTGAASGTGSISESVNMPKGSTVTYTYIVNVPSSYTGSYVNTATVAPPTGVTDLTPLNNSASDTDTQDSRADFTITKDDGKTLYVPGTSNTYTIVVTNTGPSNVTGARVTDDLPSGFTGTWTAVYAAGTAPGSAISTGSASGTGSISELVNMPTGSKVTYTYVVNVPSSYTGSYTNTVTVKAPVGVKNAAGTDAASTSATDTDTQDSRADFTITKDDGKTLYVPGTSNTYTIVVTNTGPSNVTGARVTDDLPSGFTGTWTAVYAAGTAPGSAISTGSASGTGSISELVNMPTGSKVTYTYVVNVPSSYTGSYTNTVTVKAPVGVKNAAGTDAASTSATDTDTQDSRADFTITKDDGKTLYVPGTSNTYTIVVTNTGPSNVTGARVTDDLPSGFTGTWTAVYAAGTAPGSAISTGSASGTGSISELVNMPTGSKVTYTYVVNVPSSYTGSYTNTVTVKAPVGVKNAAGTDAASTSATDTDTQDSRADFTITKDDGKTAYTPGTSNTYTIVVTNTGPSNVTGAKVTDALPAGFTGTLSAVYTGGAIGVGAGSATGTATAFATPATAINETVDMPSGSKITYTLEVEMPSNYNGVVLPAGYTQHASHTAASRYFVNEATVTVPTGVTDPTPANNIAGDADLINKIVDLKVEKVADSMNPIVTTDIKFTITATNVGPSDGSGITVTDKLKPGYTYVSSVPSQGTYNDVTGVWTIGNLVYNQSVTLEITAKVVPNETAANYENTATVDGTENDPLLTNNEVTISPVPRQLIDLEMTKTVNNTTPEVGTEITFTLDIENKGPSHATNVIVNDKLKAGYTYVSSTPSVGTYNAVTGIWTIGNLNLNAKAQMLVRVIVNPNFPGSDYENTAVASGLQLEQILPNNTAKVNTVVPIPVSDLEIVKVASTATPSINTNVAFTLTATNKGLSDASGVTVTDLLTAGFKFVSANTAFGTYNPSTGVWSIGSLGVGASVSLTINALVNETGPYINTATITGAEIDHNLANNTSTVVLNTQATPVAVDDEVKVCATSPVVIDILANDVKSVSNIIPSTVVITKQPTNGSVTIDPTTGKATYTPRAGFTGDDQFSYTVKDANGGTSNEALVKVNVNQAIVALNDLASTDPNLPVVIDILANDMVGSSTVVPGSIIITQQPVNGTITIDAAGKVTYTPKNNYVGTDSFKYTVKDVNGCTSNVATVDIRVNDLPKIGLAKAASSVVKQQNGSYNITYQFVVGNYGTSALSNVSIKDDLRNAFKGDAFSVKSITSSGTLRVNAQYNGNSVTELLATGNSLAVGEKQQLEIVVNVVVGSDQVTYLNSAIAEGSSISGIKTTDVSTDGLMPDVNGDVSSSVPTPVDLSRPKQFIPEGFSPNGDGINDTFVIANAGNKRVSLEIYNRWANRVYRSADYKNDWSGQSNEGIRISGDLPEGTYFYIIVIDGKDKYVGSITLKR